MSEDVERVTFSASVTGNDLLARLVEDKIFPAEMDAYRFAIGLGLALGKRAPLPNRRTKFNVGSFDKDGGMANLIVALRPEASSDPYRAAEELAEAGFQKMSAAVNAGEFRFSEMFEMAKEARSGQ